jgi:CheY-like chemotaxis protein
MDSADDPHANANTPGSQASPLVLIVDDEAPIAEALAYMVEDAGYTALTAFRGRAGLDLARTHYPALIITDMMMPQLDGAGLIAALRADAEADHRPMPPIIAMTAGGLRHAEAAGADAVMQKPFSVEEVESLLRRFLPYDPQRRDDPPDSRK